jgi:hypothetical protein
MRCCASCGSVEDYRVKVVGLGLAVERELDLDVVAAEILDMSHMERLVRIANKVTQESQR